MNAQLGFWPFDSERKNNLEQAIRAAAVVVKESVWPQLTAVQKAAWGATDILFNPWEKFVEQYMQVANALGRAYTSNTDYYTLWEPRMVALGWDKPILSKLMTALRQGYAAGKIAPEVIDPAHRQARGADGSPLGAFGEGVKDTMLKLGIVATLGYFGYRYVSNKF